MCTPRGRSLSQGCPGRAAAYATSSVFLQSSANTPTSEERSSQPAEEGEDGANDHEWLFVCQRARCVLADLVEVAPQIAVERTESGVGRFSAAACTQGNRPF